MGIYRPSPKLTRLDRELIKLIAKLLLQSVQSATKNQNLANDQVPLSDKEADRLLSLLEKLQKSAEFQTKQFFVSELIKTPIQHPDDGKKFQKIYMAGRRGLGKSDVVGLGQWYEFLMRAGIIRTDSDIPRRQYIQTPAVMDKEYFLRMEASLLEILGVHPRVVRLLIWMVNEHLEIPSSPNERINALRNKFKLPLLNRTKELFSSMISEINLSSTVSQMNLASAGLLVADSTVMFMTRDWSVASFFSTVAGGALSLKN